MLADDLLERLGHRVPADHARQVAAEALAERWHRTGGFDTGPRVVDLGCGPGHSVDFFRALDPSVRWTGVDLPASPEVATRVRTDAEFLDFDGVSVPLEDGVADLVFCKQVLEHVEHPAPLLADVARVLAPGGHLVGSTSQLEPYHSLSQWNYTPVGLARLIEEAGLETVEMRPGIDGLTLIVRRGLGSPDVFLRWWARESPLNRAIDGFARIRGLETRRRNALKLMFCGQFGFVARRRP